MPDDTIIKFILEEETPRQTGAAGVPAPAPGPPTAAAPGWQSQYEGIRYRGAIPAPPPAPGTPGAATQPPVDPADRLAAAMEGLTSAIRAPAKPPVRARPAPERYVRPEVVPEEEPEEPEEPEAPQIPGWATAAVGPFAGAIGARATGSATAGGVIGMGAARGVGALAAAGPPGMIAAATIGAVVVAGTALKETFDKLRATANELATSIEGVSGPVAAAMAMSEVRATMMQLRRAERVGPQLAEYVTARSRLEMSFEDLKTTVMKPLIPLVTDILRGMRDLVRLAEPVAGTIGSAVDSPIGRAAGEGVVRSLIAHAPMLGPVLLPLIEALRILVRQGRRADERAEDEADRKHIEEILRWFDPERQMAELEKRLGKEPAPEAPGPGVF